ncbi:MAG TPA: recombinase family protein, partial [Polyangiaceae bacterium]|nr:recombinase family protein [Polyangiaceae bacterium]
MPNVVTYCRVSSDEQAQKDLSIPAQRKALHRWIDERDEIELADEFVDEGESAYAPADKRPGFCRMIAYCRKHPVDFILVHKLDRFSRNREESILFKSLLRKHGVMVKSITENYDPETPQGFLYEGMIEVINQFYSMNLATETMKGMRENAERGYHNGGQSPYGYRSERLADASGREHTRLVLGPDEEVATVREIFRLAVEENRGAKTICHILNKRGVPGPRSPNWSQSSVGNVLNNRVYVGDSIWNKRNSKTGNAKNADDWIVNENTHEPIIDRELFMRRKEMAAQRTFNLRSSPRRAVKYLLARLIRCDHCGGLFVGRRQKKRSRKDGKPYDLYRYRCNTYVTKGKEVCPSIGLHCDWIEGEVIDIIRREIRSPERLAALQELVHKKIEARRSRYGKDPRELDRKLADIDRRIQNYFRAIGDGVDAKTCKEHIARLEADKAEVEEEAVLLRQDDYYRRALELNLSELTRFAAAFKDDFRQLPMAVQRRVILHFIEEIRVVDHELVRVKVKVPFDENGVRHLTDELQAPPDGGGSSALSASSKVGLLLGPARGVLDQEDSTGQALLGPARGAKIPRPPSRVDVLVHRSLEATPRGFCFFGQSSRASARSPSSFPLSTMGTILGKRGRSILRGSVDR